MAERYVLAEKFSTPWMCILTIVVVLHVRYEDMTAAVKQLAEEKPELTGTHTRITP